jgi:hypothetical protein
MKESEWYTHILQSSDWGGITLDPGQNKTIEYRVRPTSAKDPSDDGSDYYRWSVELPTGDYLVWFAFRVGENYFCPDSHYKIKDLRREAEESNAVVWMGEAKSNSLHVTHTEASLATEG